MLLLLIACQGGEPTTPTDSGGDSGTLTDDREFSHAVHIQPLWTEHCVDAGCHELSEGRVMPLEEGLAYDSLIDRASSQFPLYDLVEPGHPDGSYLVHKLAGTQTDVGGMGRQMPTGKDPLSDADQAMVWKWIQQGALP